MFLIPRLLLVAASLYSTVAGQGYPSPLAHNSSLVAHDPSIIHHNGFYYLFKGGVSVPIHKAPTLDGPWEPNGTVLDGKSVIEKANRTRPWAPSVIEKDGTFYCFYTISQRGSDNSAIGIATTKELGTGFWKDHGYIINTGTGPGSQSAPFNTSNAIDAHVFIDPKDGAAYMSYGSFFSGLWQVPLTNDLLHLKSPEKLDARRLATTLSKKRNDEEGSFMSYKAPYYYFWFSRGKCCNFEDPNNLPKAGVYSIRVGRSKNVRGPFVDKDNKPLTAGGGHVVYGSNHDRQVFAPGGLGVLSDGPQDILYYHYLNTRVGVAHLDAFMGYSYLEYVNGWPVAKYDPIKADVPKNDH